MKYFISFLPLIIQAAPFSIEYQKSPKLAYLLRDEIRKVLFIPDEFISIQKGFDKCQKNQKNHALLICINNEAEIFSNRKLINGTYKIFRKLK